ncbi:MAG: energy transducer TonB, partial [Deltaproteobacteria bacterium]|nr:energy transducer TonB [Deltaproteobacteria bacterium]
ARNSRSDTVAIGYVTRPSANFQPITGAKNSGTEETLIRAFKKSFSSKLVVEPDAMSPAPKKKVPVANRSTVDTELHMLSNDSRDELTQIEPLVQITTEQVKIADVFDNTPIPEDALSSEKQLLHTDTEIQKVHLDGDALAEQTILQNGLDSRLPGTAQNDNASESKGQVIVNDPDHANTQMALPRYDVNPRPEYPKIAKLRGWEGDVLFEVLVTKTGRVGQLQMLTSSGYRSLDNAAQKALKRWIFKPATTFGGIEIDSLVRVPIKFSLQTL